MEISEKQRKEVLSVIKKEVKRSGNCRVGWALKQVAEPKYEKSIHIKEKIANSIIGLKYSKEESKQAKDDFNIFINPNYKSTLFNKWTVIINLIITLFVIAMTFIFNRL